MVGRFYQASGYANPYSFYFAGIAALIFWFARKTLCGRWIMALAAGLAIGGVVSAVAVFLANLHIPRGAERLFLTAERLGWQGIVVSDLSASLLLGAGLSGCLRDWQAEWRSPA
jgi:hypothetical protein